MNSVITDMYRKKASCAIESGSVEETACPVVSTSSGLHYCIDRTGVHTAHSKLESVRQQSGVSSSDPPTCDEEKATTCGELVAVDDVIVIEDSHEHDKNLHSSVNMPQSSSALNISKCCSAEETLTVTCVH